MTEESSNGSGVITAVFTEVDELAPKGWRMKLAKVAAQLLVGTRQGAAVYASAREHLDEIEGRSAMNKQLFAIAASQVVNDPEMIERAKARLIGDTLRKQANLEAVIEKASERMLALPGPSGSDGFLGEAAAQADDVESDADDVLNPDWASSFSEVAENATSDDLRDRLSRVLAGEIASRGEFPRSTIRAIAELEQSDLRALLDVTLLTFNDTMMAYDADDGKILKILSEAGLVTYSDVFKTSATLNSDVGKPAAIIFRSTALIMEVSSNKSVNITGANLTRTGKAVLSLLDYGDEIEKVRSFVDRLDKTGVIRIIAGTYRRIPGDQIRIENGTLLYPEPSFIRTGSFGYR